MTTTIAGKAFISYRRARLGECEALVRALHEVGVPTWQDLADLGQGQSESQIRQVLDDPDTACAVLWLTPEVEKSDFIRQVEAPLIMGRLQRDDGFFVVPVLAGGLGYGDVDRVLDTRRMAQHPATLNLHTVHHDPADAADTDAVALRLLRERLRMMRRYTARPITEGLRVDFYSRIRQASDHVDPERALTMNWMHLFDGRLAVPGAWEDRIPLAFRSLAAVLDREWPEGRLRTGGFLPIPAAFALGTTFNCRGARPVSWLQQAPSGAGPAAEWSLEIGAEAADFKVEWTDGAVGATDAALLVSVIDDVENDYLIVRPTLPPIRVAAHVRSARGGRVVLSLGQGVTVAQRIADTLRDLQHREPDVRCLHLFMAVPAGLAVLSGQLANTIRCVQTYDHMPDHQLRYLPAARLRPSG